MKWAFAQDLKTKNFAVFHNCVVQADRDYYEEICGTDYRSWGLIVQSTERAMASQSLNNAARTYQEADEASASNIKSR